MSCPWQKDWERSKCCKSRSARKICSRSCIGSFTKLVEEMKSSFVNWKWPMGVLTQTGTRRILAMCVAVSLLAPAPAGRAQSADAKLHLFFQAYLDRHFRQQPLAATGLGDHRFDAQLENVNPESRRLWQELTEKTLAELPRQIDYDKLSRDSQIDYKIFEHSLKEDE